MAQPRMNMRETQEDDLFQDIIENTNPELDNIRVSSLASLDLHSRDQNAFLSAKRRRSHLNLDRFDSLSEQNI